MNHFIFTGRFGQDPELVTTKTGTKVLNFSLARNEKYKDKDETIWARFEAFGDTAERIARYFVKGKMIRVYASFRNNDYEDADGNRVRNNVFSVFRFDFPEVNVPPDKEEGDEEKTTAKKAKDTPKPKAKPKSAPVPDDDEELDF